MHCGRAGALSTFTHLFMLIQSMPPVSWCSARERGRPDGGEQLLTYLLYANCHWRQRRLTESLVERLATISQPGSCTQETSIKSNENERGSETNATAEMVENKNNKKQKKKIEESPDCRRNFRVAATGKCARKNKFSKRMHYFVVLVFVILVLVVVLVVVVKCLFFVSKHQFFFCATSATQHIHYNIAFTTAFSSMQFHDLLAPSHARRRQLPAAIITCFFIVWEYIWHTQNCVAAAWRWRFVGLLSPSQASLSCSPTTSHSFVPSNPHNLFTPSIGIAHMRTIQTHFPTFIVCICFFWLFTALFVHCLRICHVQQRCLLKWPWHVRRQRKKKKKKNS